MKMDLTGIRNQNEYYTNHYFSTIFEENAEETISAWRTASRENEEIRTPWSLLRETARQYYTVHDRFKDALLSRQMLYAIRSMAELYLNALGYPDASPETIPVDDHTSVPVYLELKKDNGMPYVWICLAASKERDSNILTGSCFDSMQISEDSYGAVPDNLLTAISNEDLATKIFFGLDSSPRFIIYIGIDQIALLDRNKWNKKRYLEFELDDIFSRREESTLQAMAVLLHRDSLCPEDGRVLLDELDEQSQKNASGVSDDLKYALRESIELLGNEVLYDMAKRQDRNLESDPVDAGDLTLECLRYMYRMLFVLFIESRPELGYAPIKSQTYYSGYSLESLRDIAANTRDDIEAVGDGYYLFESLQKLYSLIYSGYPANEADLKNAEKAASDGILHDVFVVEPLKAHIFDPELTRMITNAKIRNAVMLRILDLMSFTRETGRKNDRRGRISYANLGINQMGAVYEALLSYRGFIAGEDLYEVKRNGDSFNELEVGYFVPEKDLDQYEEDERVRRPNGELRMYRKGTFIYRLAGREREKSASYYTPEVLTKCLVKYALKELLKDKSADDILQLTICEPAMGSAAFLNEAINQLAEAYLERKQKETGESISYDRRFQELQKVKMFIADRNVYGIDLNPTAVELAEVSLWLNTIYAGGYVPWFGTQLVNGNSLIGARRQVYHTDMLRAKGKGLHWYENEPKRVPLGTKRGVRTQIYHFLLGDPGMDNYTDKVIKSLEPENIQKIKDWNKKFIAPYSEADIRELLRLSGLIDRLWEEVVKLREEISRETSDNLSIYGYTDPGFDSHTSIREKDRIYNELFKSEKMSNAGPYARLKLAMDYWCSLWFWPIDRVDDLPTRSEFLFEMSLIIEGTFRTSNQDNLDYVQLSFLQKDQEEQKMALELQEKMSQNLETMRDMGVVDIPALSTMYPRIALVQQIAEQNHFMHWELEFADQFAEKGGFDLVIGNPPWIKIEWNEEVILSDMQPVFAVKKLTANQTIRYRDSVLKKNNNELIYEGEYVAITGEQYYLNAFCNYPILKGQQTNLYKCFLPQSWYANNRRGVSAFVHPDGVFDDPKGNAFRRSLYPRLRRHYQFINEKLLFKEVGHPTIFSLNVYGEPRSLIADKFHSISNLFIPSTIDECYAKEKFQYSADGLKDSSGKWSVKGHPDRILYYGQEELNVLAKLSGNDTRPLEARLLSLNTRQLLETIEKMAEYPRQLRNEEVFFSEMWHETYAQNDGTLRRNTNFPQSEAKLICSGPHIAVGLPLAKTPRRICLEKADYDNIDLTSISADYLPRSNYEICVDEEEYKKRDTKIFNKYYFQFPKIVSRKMLNLKQERTFNVAILPENVGHINGLVGVVFKNEQAFFISASTWISIPFDFYVKVMGKANFNFAGASGFPIISSQYDDSIIARGILLNCLTVNYSKIYKEAVNNLRNVVGWSKTDRRLTDNLSQLTSEWNFNVPFRSDFERRMALVEVDILTAMALRMTLDQLINIYRLQFPVSQQYEADTWYDTNGRIVFTINRSLGGVGFTRAEWENGIKGAPAGKKFYRTIEDDTMPGGPVQRTIEYVAPFDRCDRIEDYKTAWKFFEEKYKDQK